MFSPANTKLKKLYNFKDLKPWLKDKRKVYSFDLISGHSCPFAKECYSKVVETPEGLRVQDGIHTLFRCYSASQEAIYRNAYNKRKANMESVRNLTRDKVCRLLMDNKPKNMGVCRIHAAGDFISPTYFRGWMSFAEKTPDVLFYAYTKCLPYWVNNRFSIPDNVILTASRGGRKDDMIEPNNLRSVKVVFSEQEANDLGLEIDQDDSHACNPNKRNDDFALLIHGIQPKGSEAATALQAVKRKAAV
jgi:hypothetical protein